MKAADGLTARRYALALIEATRASQSGASVREQIHALGQRLAAAPAAALFLNMPTLGAGKKLERLLALVAPVAERQPQPPSELGAVPRESPRLGQGQSGGQRPLAGDTVSPVVKRFLGLLIEKKRAALLPLIAERFEELWDELGGVTRVHLTSASPLAAAEESALTQKLSAAGPVKVEKAVDEELLAGCVLRAGDRLWDLSLRGRWKRLKDQLVESN